VHGACIKAERGDSVMSQSGRSQIEPSAVRVVEEEGGAGLQSVCSGREAESDA